MAGKKIKLDDEAISEILVADTILRLAILKTILRGGRQRGSTTTTMTTTMTTTTTTTTTAAAAAIAAGASLSRNQNRLKRVAYYQSGDCLKEGTQIFVLLSVQRKV